jgi:hypothetical protein
VVFVEVSQQQASKVGPVIAEFVDRFGYHRCRAGKAGVDEGETISALPQVGVADGKAEHVQLGE